MSTATAASALEPEDALRVAGLLDPFADTKEHTPMRVAREFALATAEIGCGLMQRAGRRYTWILDQLARHQVFDKMAQEGFRDGSTHGRAQAEVTAGAPDALKLADELERCDPFFRPHVESIRMTFHGYRGEKELADFHRRRGEMLALQGGLSWSAFTAFSIRTAYISMATQDTLSVMQASVELDRLVAIAPNAALYRDLCQAYVAMTRGQTGAALEIYERIRSAPNARLMPAFEIDASLHAEALVRAGRLEEAKRMCEDAITMRKAQDANAYLLRFPTQELALVEAQLGNFARAKALLAELTPVVEASQAPLPIGVLQRDLARVALMERDAAAFDRHFEAMLAAFRPTKNPVLVQQCRRLLAEAEKCGVVAAPNWEKHELVAPANTQDLASQAPDVTELVETYS